MKTQAVQELMLQAWWDETMIYSDHFFDATANMNTLESEEMFSLYHELQMIRASFEQADYPAFVQSARQHLLNSMAEVMLSFKAYFAGDNDIARLCMQTAQMELGHLQNEVDRLGLPRFMTNPRIH